MTGEGVLFVAVAVMTVMLWVTSYILVRAAHQKPRIPALSVMAVLIPLLAIGFTDYVWSVLNASWGYPIPKEVAQFIFRGLLLAIGGWALWFVYLYLSGRFRDEA